MRILKAFTFVAVAGALVAGAAQAQSGTGVIHSTGYYPTQAGGWYTSPYQAYFTNVVPGTGAYAGFALPTAGSNTLYDIFCVDFGHHLQNYSANFSNLANGQSVLNFTRTGNITKYTMAAWLASQLAIAPASANGVINAAIWQVMSGTLAPTLGLSQSDINFWKTGALTGTINAAEWVVVTDQNKTETDPYKMGQEFIVRVQVTPEPATLLLLGTGLLATLMAAGALRRSAV